MTGYSAELFQNEFLASGATEVNAIVTVTSSGGNVNTHTPTTEIIILDCSGSMQAAGKMPAARKAAAVAIGALREGVLFAVLAGSGEAYQVFPPQGTLAVSTHATRAEAQHTVGQLQPQGGTALGRWLRSASALFATGPAEGVRHAILLTDGKDEGEKPADLAAALRDLSGTFQCDCRGVGTDWSVHELRLISNALLGTVDIVADPKDLAADFAAIMATAMSKVAADVSLRVWTPTRSRVRFVKQVAPAVVDLTGRRAEAGPRAGDYPTGSWGTESRDYHVCFDVDPGGVGEEMAAGRISLISEGVSVAEAPVVRAVWTEEAALSTKINAEVAHYTGQAELAQAIQEGLEARKAGDITTATAKLGRAAQLANEGGNEDTAKLLRTVVDVEDAATGTVRLKKQVEVADEMALDTRSTKTVRVRGGS